MPRRPRARILLVSMYPLDRGLWGPTVRITSIRDALSRVVDLDVVSGWRGARTREAWRYWRSGRLHGLDGVYVESATTAPGPADVAFVQAARRAGVPVLTFIRDAYPLFPEYEDRSAKGRLRSVLWAPAMRLLARASSGVAYPSEGLADAFPVDRPVFLLPPGAPKPLKVARKANANQLLHVGSLRHPDMGASLLVEAAGLARGAGHEVEVTCVTRPEEEPPGERPEWLRIVHASGPKIHALLPGVLATVIPRRRTPYNDLAVPVKAMENLSYGRPTLVTDCIETARLIRVADSGPVVDDTPEAMAEAIGALRTAPPEQLDRWSEGAREAAVANSWDVRADDVLRALRGLRQ
jgi:glycosyltransferase involved in cell wall biosynthesis